MDKNEQELREQERQKDLQRLRQLRPIDDDFLDRKSVV